MPETNTRAIRTIMDKLLSNPSDQGQYGFLDFFQKVVTECTNCRIDYLPNEAFAYWWHLVRVGALVPKNTLGTVSALPVFDVFVLTDRGKRLVEQGQNSPHDPGRYLAAVRKRIASPDETVMTYLDEAVGTWGAGFYRASAVMLGCACERLVLILAERLADSNSALWSEKLRSKLDEAPVGISKLFELIRQCLMEMKRNGKLAAEMGDALDRKLSAIFDHARVLRNNSGHPTGTHVSEEDAEAGLLLFPGFYASVDALGRHSSQGGAQPQ